MNISSGESSDGYSSDSESESTDFTPTFKANTSSNESTYKPGALAALLGGSKKKTSTVVAAPIVSAAAYAKAQMAGGKSPQDSDADQKSQDKSKSRQLSRDEIKKLKGAARRLAEDEAAEAEDTQLSRRQKAKQKKPLSEEREGRTIFVGNVALEVTKKMLKKLFKPYGRIESIRYRSGSFANPTMPKKAAFITENYHPTCDSHNSYVVFETQESAQSAVEEMNGQEVAGKHIRVDIASNKSHNTETSAFVGNLPFDAREEELRELFDGCGEVTNVRIVRDKRLGIGKGIAFVAFETKEALSQATALNGCTFKGRELRIFKASKKPKNLAKRNAMNRLKSKRKKLRRALEDDEGNERKNKKVKRIKKSVKFGQQRGGIGQGASSSQKAHSFMGVTSERGALSFKKRGKKRGTDGGKKPKKKKTTRKRLKK